MNENELLKRIAITKAKPDTVTDLQPRELAELVLVVLQYAKEIKQQIEEGKIKGDKGEDGKDGAEYIPQPDVDYLSLPTAKAELENFKAEVVSKVLSDVQNAILSLENGKDGVDGLPGKDGVDGRDGKDGINGLNGLDAVVTEEDIKQAADLAFKMIELPDFRIFITEQPEAIRDSLELLQGDDRLDASAIKNLDKFIKNGQPDMMVGGIRFLSQLADVRITSLANGDTLVWNSTTLQWENGAGGGTITGTDTQVLFFDGNDNPAGDSEFTYNKTTNLLTVNTVDIGRGTGTDSMLFGASSTASGDNSISIGTGNTASNTGSVSIGQFIDNSGYGSFALGNSVDITGDSAVSIGGDIDANDAIAIGAGSYAGGEGGIAIGRFAVNDIGATDSIAIGQGAEVNTNKINSIALGALSFVNYNNSIGIGHDATPSADNQIVFGPDTGDNTGFNEMYLGQGIINVGGTSHFTMRVTGRQGTNLTGNNFNITSGKSVGTGIGGDINFQTSDAGASGTTLNDVTTKLTLTGPGKLKLRDTSSAYYAILDASSIASSDKTFLFPNNSGTFALTSDIPAATTPGGSDTQVQYNDGGVFDGDPLFVWDKTVSQLALGLPSDIGAGNAQVPFVITGNDNNYYGMSIQNLNAGDSASSDYLVSADNDGTAIAGHYGDFGINSSGYVGLNVGVIKTVSIHTAGTGYTVGDIVDITGGDSNGQIEILTVNGGGGATSIAIHDNGSGYTVTNFATTGGTGSGFRVNVLTLYDYTGFSANDVYLTSAGGHLVIGSDDTGPNSALKFFSNGFATTNQRMQIDNNVSVYSNLGTEKAPALTGLTGVNWTYANPPWDLTLNTLNHNADGTTTITPSAATTIVVGTTYKVVLTVTGWTTGTFSFSLGGVVPISYNSSGVANSSLNIGANGTFTAYVTATTTGKIIFSPSNTARFQISALSIKPLTDAQGDVTIDGNLSVRSPANFDAKVTVNNRTGLANNGPQGDNWFAMGAGGTLAHTGQFIVAMGSSAVQNPSAGSANLGIGFSCLSSGSLTGNDNLAFGTFAGRDTTTGNNNCFYGSSSGIQNTTGGRNTGFGRETLQGNLLSWYNTAIGYQAMALFAGTNSDGKNVAVGAWAGYSLTTGQNNIIISAGTNSSGTTGSPGITTGAGNTVIGVGVGNLGNPSNNIVIANGSGTNNTAGIKAQHDNTNWTLTATSLLPSANDTLALGSATLSHSDLFLASGALINYANGNVILTHSSGILTMGTGEFRITTVGTNAASVPTLQSTSTLTNKRITKRTLVTNAPGATPTTATDTYDMVLFTGLATAITSMTTNLSGTPTEGQTLWIAFTDNGTARAITWGSSFEASTVALPTTTVISTRLDVGFVWNTVTSKWRCVAVA